MYDIYICHEYDDKSHFFALYKCAKQNGFRIVDYIIIDYRSIIKKCIKTLFLHHRPLIAFSYLKTDLHKLHELKGLENKIIIVGIAPYNKLMLRYKKLFSRNKCIYFTSWQSWDGKEFARGKARYKSQFESVLHDCFFAAACVTERTKKELSHIMSRAVVVNHSIPIEEYEKKETTEDYKSNKYIYMGRFDENKNIKLILNYLKTNKDDNIEVHFAGWGALEKDIVKASRQDSRIKYLGRLSKDEIKETLHEYRFLLLCSSREAFGIVLIEALSAGVPCVVSDASGPIEIIENNYNGFVFSLNEGINGFKRVLRLTEDISLQEYITMSNNCLASAARYSENCIFDKWRYLFSLILSEYPE